MGQVLAVVIRVLGLIAAAALAFWAGNLGYDPAGGANIGAGLLAFAALLLVAFVWSIVDGLRTGRFGTTLLRWLVVAVVIGVVSAVQAQGYSPGLDLDVLASDLRGLTPFTFGLVAVPAAVGCSIGLAIHRARLKRSTPAA